MDDKKYGKLLSQTMPAVISDQVDYERIESITLDLLGKARSPEEDRLFDLLTSLLENFEQKSLNALEPVGPRELLRFLMDENDLKQSDLQDVFGTQSVVSEILTGKRQINLNQAKRLAERFGVSAALFVQIA